MLKYKIIKSLKQYNTYCDRHEQLSILEDNPSTDEVELLELLIDDYEKRTSAVPDFELSPIDLLKSLMEDNAITQIKLAKELNVSRQLISDILNYHRNISKSMVVKLAKYFAIQQEALSKPYYLKNDPKKKSKVKTKV